MEDGDDISLLHSSLSSPCVGAPLSSVLLTAPCSSNGRSDSVFVHLDGKSADQFSNSSPHSGRSAPPACVVCIPPSGARAYSLISGACGVAWVVERSSTFRGNAPRPSYTASDSARTGGRQGRSGRRFEEAMVPRGMTQSILTAFSALSSAMATLPLQEVIGLPHDAVPVRKASFQ